MTCTSLVRALGLVGDEGEFKAYFHPDEGSMRGGVQAEMLYLAGGEL
jgi:hypothetical protein